jgi:hypothetical protein
LELGAGVVVGKLLVLLLLVLSSVVAARRDLLLVVVLDDVVEVGGVGDPDVSKSAPKVCGPVLRSSLRTLNRALLLPLSPFEPVRMSNQQDSSDVKLSNTGTLALNPVTVCWFTAVLSVCCRRVDVPRELGNSLIVSRPGSQRV